MEEETEWMDRFESISPIDYRYADKEMAAYLSENGFTRYKLKTEAALVSALADRGICSQEIAKEVEEACDFVTTKDVYDEENVTKHDIRALVNCIRSHLSDEAKPYVHMTATSYDISDTANAARFRDAVKKVLVPRIMDLEKVLIDLVLREAETPQIGRTHGQHAVPITFGFALAKYVNSLGESLEELDTRADKLPGKFSGAVGAYNASSLFFEDAEKFEEEVLAKMGLKPAAHATQIAPSEPMMRLMQEVGNAAGAMAGLARDMRHLQRTEIGEVGEAFGAKQVGSSTMAHKMNPINFENAESLWKIVAGRMVTVSMDQLSEHQRDLTNSASSRTYAEIVAYTASMAKRLTRTMSKLVVNQENLKRNFARQKDLVLAEPAYIMLAALGHPDAHEAIRVLSQKARQDEKTLQTEIFEDSSLKPYIASLKPEQLAILSGEKPYQGLAPEKAKKVALSWKNKLANYRKEA